ncbi:MAG: hypothetical protein U1A27_01115 [Phycisphaerae bacterium]
MQDAGYAAIRPGGSLGGLAVLDRADICGECVGRLIGHPHVRRLRAQLAARDDGAA